LWAPSVSIPWWIINRHHSRVVVAIFGYRWIHNVQKVMTAIFMVVIAIALIQAALYGPVAHESLGFGLSSFPIFIAVIGLVFMNMLSWATLRVRLLPVPARGRKLSQNILGDFQRANPVDVPFMALGAWVTALVPDAATNPLGALSRVAGVWILFFMALSQMAGVTLNAYYRNDGPSPASGATSSASWRARPRQAVAGRRASRVVSPSAPILALLGYKTFLTSFEKLH